jgi:hypothetical protein
MQTVLLRQLQPPWHGEVQRAPRQARRPQVRPAGEAGLTPAAVPATGAAAEAAGADAVEGLFWCHQPPTAGNRDTSARDSGDRVSRSHKSSSAHE